MSGPRPSSAERPRTRTGRGVRGVVDEEERDRTEVVGVPVQVSLGPDSYVTGLPTVLPLQVVVGRLSRLSTHPVPLAVGPDFSPLSLGRRCTHH